MNSDTYCPRCRTNTLVRKRGKRTRVEVEQCSTCRGLWFDRDELEGMLDVAARELRTQPGATQSGRVCPRCHTPMHSFSYPQTMAKIDMCDTCDGLWLDSGEFQEVRVVRRHLQEEGELDEFAPVTGIKGGLIRFIDSAIDAMM